MDCKVFELSDYRLQVIPQEPPGPQTPHWQIRWKGGDVGAVAETEGQAWMQFLLCGGKRACGFMFMKSVACLKDEHGVRAVEVRR